MTEETTETLHDELAAWLSCKTFDITHSLKDGSIVDIAAVTTASEAREAFRRTRSESPERPVVLVRWIELVGSFDELCEIPVTIEEYQHNLTVGYHFYIRMVTLCETREQVLRTARQVRPNHLMWPMLVNRGLQILRKEKEAAQA